MRARALEKLERQQALTKNQVNGQLFKAKNC